MTHTELFVIACLLIAAIVFIVALGMSLTHKQYLIQNDPGFDEPVDEDIAVDHVDELDDAARRWEGQ